MPSAARTELACLASACRERFPLRDAFDTWAAKHEALRSYTRNDWRWDALNAAEFDARADLMAELSLLGLDWERVRLLGEIL